MTRGHPMSPRTHLPSYPPPAASQPAIEGAQSAGRPWITLHGATKT